jgi:hypothetical protein
VQGFAPLHPLNFKIWQSQRKVVTSKVAKPRNGGTMSESAFGFY